MFEIPTGTGKSLVINLAAHALLKFAGVKRVLVVSATPFLSQFGYLHYSLKDEGTDGFAPDTAGKKSIHFPMEGFGTIPDSYLGTAAVLLDETDACFNTARCSIDAASKPGFFTFHHTAQKLAKAKAIVGISGTFGDDARR